MRHLSSSRCAVWTTTRQPQQTFYLQDVVAGLHVCDVDPLAVNVMPVGIPAANSDALCAEICTLVPLLNSWIRKRLQIL